MNITRIFTRYYKLVSPVSYSTTSLFNNHCSVLNKPTHDASKIPKCSVSSVESKVVGSEKESIFTKLLKKVPFLNVDKYRLNVTAFLLYEAVADRINYAEFFEEFSLPDTFYSWFVITEVHLWMLMCRCMAEGEDGRFVRNKIVQALWSDVGLRTKKIGTMNPSAMRGQVRELSEQFQAALIAYDEGIQSDDVVLAGAVWRRMYQKQEVDPEHLELLVKYIRRQLRILDHVPREQLFSQDFSWTALMDKQEKQ